MSETRDWHQDREIYTGFQSEGRTFFWHVESSSQDGTPEFDIEWMHEPGTDTLWRRWRLSSENDGLENPEKLVAEFTARMHQKRSPVSMRVNKAIRDHIKRQGKST